MLKPHLRRCWCIPPDANAEFVARMEDVLDVYCRPYGPRWPQICMDEQPVQIIGETRVPLPPAPGRPECYDYEYERHGTANIFLWVEPLAGRRGVPVAPPLLASRDRGGHEHMTGRPAERQGFLLLPEACRPHAEPVLISACLLGIPCRWHGRRPKRRDALIAKLKRRYVLVPVCPEQLGGMPTPRTGERLPGPGAGAAILDGKLRLFAPETGTDVTRFHVAGAECAIEIARIVGARKAYLKGGSPSCDREGVTGELLRRAGIEVVRVP